MTGIFAMFLILFKNIKLSIIGVVPNFIAAFFILGIIGLLNIPLDMMTITIAAITIGIAVDNSIHYIYRFREEFSNINDYKKTLNICHSTVGRAILNTSITIVFGFSILILSKFIPTISRISNLHHRNNTCLHLPPPQIVVLFLYSQVAPPK